MESSIWVAVITGLPKVFALSMIRFCAIGTFSADSSIARSPRATITPSKALRMPSM